MRPAPVSRSEPTIDSSRPSTITAIALSTEPFASTTAKIRPSTISEKYSAGPNSSARPVSGAPSAATSTVATQPAKNEPIAAIDKRGARASLPRHLVAVERGDHGRRFARDVDQDRGGRAAVLRAVIDAGEHDQGADRRQAEGDRQQHRDGRDRADAGQHARPACRPVRRADRTGCCRAGPRPQSPAPGSREGQTCLIPPRQESRPELEGQIEQIGEQKDTERRHDRGRDETLQHPHLPGSQNRDHEGHVACDHHAHRPDHRRESQDRRDDQNRPANLVFLDAGSVGDETDQRDQRTKYDEETGEKSRRSARTECKSPLTGKVAATPRWQGSPPRPEPNHPRNPADCGSKN